MTRRPDPKRIPPIYENDNARLFDLIVYEEKEAEAAAEELAFLDWVFEEEARREVRDILDVGCGNGRFTLPLARSGYRLTALDCGVGVLRECRRRIKENQLDAKVLRRRIERLDFDRAFDAIIGMDSVICYVHDTQMIVETLKRFCRALRPGGMVVLSNGNVLARIQDGISSDPQVTRVGKVHIVHRENNWYDPYRSLYHIRIHGTVTEGKQKKTFDHEEAIRVMTPEEMRTYFQLAGFEAIQAFPTFDPKNLEDVEEDYLTFTARRPKR